MTKSSIVVTGANGQLGKTLSQYWPAASLLDRYDLRCLSHSELELTGAADVERVLSELKPSIIVNAAAYTQVDKAETEAEDAFAVNHAAVSHLANWAKENQARLIHVSTDFVFDGTATQAYLPTDRTSPLGVYGESKLAGENALRQILPERSAIIRTSWLYSEHGNNFVKTMLRLMAERDHLSVVADQIGSPTSTHSLTQLIFAMIRQESGEGIYHWSDGASISWFDFAVAIQKVGLALGLLDKEIAIQAIPSSDYPTPAKRPGYSVLDCSRAQTEFPLAFPLSNTDWQQELTKVIQVLV